MDLSTTILRVIDQVLLNFGYKENWFLIFNITVLLRKLLFFKDYQGLHQSINHSTIVGLKLE
jgi:hypothetical protein